MLHGYRSRRPKVPSSWPALSLLAVGSSGSLRELLLNWSLCLRRDGKQQGRSTGGARTELLRRMALARLGDQRGTPSRDTPWMARSFLKEERGKSIVSLWVHRQSLNLYTCVILVFKLINRPLGPQTYSSMSSSSLDLESTRLDL